MASIKMKNLEDFNLLGSNLFDDSESFLTEINDDVSEQIIGGCTLTVQYTP
jgi:hypothetical protein